MTVIGSNNRFTVRITRDCPRFKDELDLMKFVCKDFWMALYRKQVDNLRTNHQVSYFCNLFISLGCFLPITEFTSFYLVI